MTRHLSMLADTFVSLRQNRLRSLLSILGLVIGVAALVAILALADGMEQYARDQIGLTTNLQNVTVTPRTVDWIDGVAIRRPSVVVPAPSDVYSLAARLAGSAIVSLVQQRSAEIVFDSVHTAAPVFAADHRLWALGTAEVQDGRLFTADDVQAARSVVVLSAALATRLAPEAAPLVGRRLRVGAVEAEIVGVLSNASGRGPEVYGPYSAFAMETDQRPPAFFLRVDRAEEILLVVDQVNSWLDSHYPEGAKVFTVATNVARASQIREGMLLFKLIFGLITGISVVVGGVGVMNVLLVTVTERTREIGIRKAVGARRQDIRLQFLGEAMTVSGVGSMLGLIVGTLGVFALVPIIRRVTEVTLHAALTGQTLVLVAAVAVTVGLVFGTYPASRAARLSPVDAMRHE